jgi:hypothetical protein
MPPTTAGIYASQNPTAYFVRTIEEREEESRNLKAFLEKLNEVMGWPSREERARWDSMRPETV